MSQDINKNRSIADALSYEEKFFRDHLVLYTFLKSCFDLKDGFHLLWLLILYTFPLPFILKIYSGLAGCCGISQLSRKLNQVGLSHFFASLLVIHSYKWSN